MTCSSTPSTLQVRARHRPSSARAAHRAGSTGNRHGRPRHRSSQRVVHRRLRRRQPTHQRRVLDRRGNAGSPARRRAPSARSPSVTWSAARPIRCACGSSTTRGSAPLRTPRRSQPRAPRTHRSSASRLRIVRSSSPSRRPPTVARRSRTTSTPSMAAPPGRRARRRPPPARSSSVGLVNGTSYSVRLRAANAVGSGAPSSTVVGVPLTVPGAPSSIHDDRRCRREPRRRLHLPVSDGGSAIVSYQYSTDAGATWRDRQTGSTDSPLRITETSSNPADTIDRRAASTPSRSVR